MARHHLRLLLHRRRDLLTDQMERTVEQRAKFLGVDQFERAGAERQQGGASSGERLYAMRASRHRCVKRRGEERW